LTVDIVVWVLGRALGPLKFMTVISKGYSEKSAKEGNRLTQENGLG